MPSCICWRIAGRIGVELELDDLDGSATTCRCWSICMPSGKFLMEDFYYAGGLPAVIRELGELGSCTRTR